MADQNLTSMTDEDLMETLNTAAAVLNSNRKISINPACKDAAQLENMINSLNSFETAENEVLARMEN